MRNLLKRSISIKPMIIHTSNPISALAIFPSGPVHHTYDQVSARSRAGTATNVPPLTSRRPHLRRRNTLPVYQLHPLATLRREKKMVRLPPSFPRISRRTSMAYHNHPNCIPQAALFSGGRQSAPPRQSRQRMPSSRQGC